MKVIDESLKGLENDEARDKKEDYLQKIVRYSTFSAKEIMPILCDICNIYEYSGDYNVDYSDGIIANRTNVVFYFPNITRLTFFIVEENYDDVFTLNKKDYKFALTSLTLDRGIPYSKSARFSYTYAFCREYIKEFISYVVAWRIKNDKDNISSKDLKELEKSFLAEKREELEKIFEERNREEQARANDNALKRKQILDKIAEN